MHGAEPPLWMICGDLNTALANLQLWKTMRNTRIKSSSTRRLQATTSNPATTCFRKASSPPTWKAQLAVLSAPANTPATPTTWSHYVVVEPHCKTRNRGMQTPLSKPATRNRSRKKSHMTVRRSVMTSPCGHAAPVRSNFMMTHDRGSVAPVARRRATISWEDAIDQDATKGSAAIA